jgi:N-acetylglutamate synthase-like GNAT family acetyltransferase
VGAKNILMIVKCVPPDFPVIYEIINDGAQAYRGVIPEDCWHDPYMPEQELRKQIADGVQFWKYMEDENVTGVMGLQLKNDVTLIRHAYVRTSERNKGIGGKLLRHLCAMTQTPILIGTWSDATWAIEFYKKHGFRQVSTKEKDRLLEKYWSIPKRQVETSVVLVSDDWKTV